MNKLILIIAAFACVIAMGGSPIPKSSSQDVLILVEDEKMVQSSELECDQSKNLENSEANDNGVGAGTQETFTEEHLCKVEETVAPIEETSVSIEETKESDIDTDQLEMLACVIYQEAGSDSVCDDCRRRVADVVLNRIQDNRFPNTMEEVLTSPSQYGRYHWTGVVWPDSSKYDCEKSAVERAYRIANEVLRGNHSDLYGNGYIWQAEFPQGSDNIYCCGIYFGK